MIRYANTEFKIKPKEEIALEYINKWDIKHYGPKQIILIYDNKHKINIPIEKIITLNHNITKNFFLVSDNILSKDREINIIIYSPIIFKNKSRYNLQIKLQNVDIGDTILNFEPDSIFGIPFPYYNSKTQFSFILVNSKSSNSQTPQKSKNNAFSSSFNLSEIVNTESHQRYRKYIYLPNRKILLMKMKKQIGELRTILITCEYSIINCLPCDIFVETAERGLMIEKCSQQFIDFYPGSGLEMVIKIFMVPIIILIQFINNKIVLIFHNIHYNNNNKCLIHINNKILYLFQNLLIFKEFHFSMELEVKIVKMF